MFELVSSIGYSLFLLERFLNAHFYFAHARFDYPFWWIF